MRMLSISLEFAKILQFANEPRSTAKFKSNLSSIPKPLNYHGLKIPVAELISFNSGFTAYQSCQD